MKLVRIVFAVLAIVPAGAPAPGADLRQGMVLIYASDGRDQPPWSIDFVEAGASLKANADCSRLRIRRQPAETAQESRLCVENGMLLAWDSDRDSWLPQRPVGSGMALTLTRPNGDVVRYQTGAASEEVIGSFRLQVVETTATTTDSAGRPLRRLRERYALTLATATGGRFEVPDPDVPGAWRTQQVFELREIRIPA